MQLSRTQWLDQGLLTLADKGPQYVKIDVLCLELGVTKGSFYHHFSHHADFVSGLTLCLAGISMAMSTGTGRGWLSNSRGKPTTPSKTNTAAPMSR